jgi:hypothetical protein
MVSRLRGNDNGAISVKWGSSDSRRRDNLTLCLPRYDFVIDHSCLQLSCDGSDRDVETAGVSTYFSWFFRQLTYHHIPPPPTHCLYERGMDRTTCRNRRGFDLLFARVWGGTANWCFCESMVSRLRGNDNGAIAVKWGSSDSRRRDNLTLCLPRYDFVIDHSCLQFSCNETDRDVETAGVSTYFSWFFRQLTYHHKPPPRGY